LYITLAELEQAASSPDGAGSLPIGGDALIEELRVDAGVSPTAMAAAIGVSERTWYRYEKGIGERFATRATDQRAARLLAYLAGRVG